MGYSTQVETVLRRILGDFRTSRAFSSLSTRRRCESALQDKILARTQTIEQLSDGTEHEAGRWLLKLRLRSIIGLCSYYYTSLPFISLSLPLLTFVGIKVIKELQQRQRGTKRSFESLRSQYWHSFLRNVSPFLFSCVEAMPAVVFFRFLGLSLRRTSGLMLTQRLSVEQCATSPESAAEAPGN